MEAVRIPGHTRIVGADQAYRPLPIRDESIDCGTILGQQPCMATHWLPTPEELERLNAGAPVVVRILGRIWPPALIEVERIMESRDA